MSSFSIVRRKFSPIEFCSYVAHTDIGSWTKLVVLHNTASPSLAQRPSGILTEDHIDSLHDYYQYRAPSVRGGWSGGPHLFIDAGGIWVFNPLNRPGIHSPSYNKTAWGVEILGDYAVEPFEIGLGAIIRGHTILALSAMLKRLGFASATDDNVKFHKEDPRTDHDCPGRLVEKPAILEAVSRSMPGVLTVRDVPVEIVVIRPGEGPHALSVPGFIRDGVSYADAALLSKALGLPQKVSGEAPVVQTSAPAYRAEFDPIRHRVILIRN